MTMMMCFPRVLPLFCDVRLLSGLARLPWRQRAEIHNLKLKTLVQTHHEDRKSVSGREGGGASTDAAETGEELARPRWKG